MTGNTLIKLLMSFAFIVQGVFIVQSNPLIPMGALTGKPTRAEIHAILAKYKAAGINQYLVYPRSGCELEYLSNEYLDTLATVCEEAEKLDFSAIWLYDEFNWPSGSCGKRVPLENPKFAMPFICAYKQDGKIKVEIRHNPDYTALMNPAAVDRFIELTHEQYYKRLKPYFGKLIKGIFTDEPEIGYWKDKAPDAIFCMGYYEGLEDDYRKLTGGDLFADIAAGLRGDPNYYPAVCAELLAKRFRTSYIDRLQAWCEKHGIVLTGHLMNENHPVSARKSNGNILKVLPGFGLPGMDEINTKNTISGAEWLTMGTAMYAIEKRGNKGGLGELFAIGPCDLTFTRLNQMLYLTAAFGVDHYVLGIAPVDSRGCAHKPNWYNSFASDQPQMAVFDEWSKAAKRAAELAKKERSFEIAVRYGNGEERLQDLLISLVRHQISWRLLDNEEAAPDDIPMVLVLRNDGKVWEEKNILKSYNFDYLWNIALKDRLPLSSVVCDTNGRPVDDVFLRRYRDGSVLVIDMSKTDRELVLHRNKQKEPFMLYANGVKEFPPTVTGSKTAGKTAVLAQKIPNGWQVEFDRPHLCRMHFNEKNVAELELQEAQNLRLALRIYNCKAKAEFNGKLLKNPRPCTELPDTFNTLYNVYDLGIVPAGRHRLELHDAGSEYPFLPQAVFIGEKLSDYVGKITQKCRYQLPETAGKFRITEVPAPGAAELLVDGVSLGKKLVKPYEWQIPAGSQGKSVEIVVEHYLSVGGLFGTPWTGSDEASRWRRQALAPKRQNAGALTVEIE